MNNSNFRVILFISIVGILLSADYFGLSKVWLIYAFLGVGWLFFTGLVNDIVERVSGGRSEKFETGRGEKRNKYNLISFNDTLA